MAATLLGISGSPIPKSNTDRTIAMILEATGMDYELIKLSRLNVQPCRACLGCVRDNTCVVKDDGQELAEKFRECAGFVIGGFTPYSSLDARTKAFMERMYCLRHRNGLNQGKPGVSVIATAIPPGTEGLPPAGEMAGNQIMFWMMEEGMQQVGTLTLVGNVPCIKCGFGDSCEQSGVRMIHGQDATVESVGVNAIEDDAATTAKAKELGEQLRAAVEQRQASTALSSR